jgi:hypothetical protein
MMAVVRFATEPQRITVVYSDSDDGEAQERLIATSPLKFGRNETLGEITDVPESAARCTWHHGAIGRSSWGQVEVLPISDK